MTKSLSLLVLIGSVYLLDACGGSSGSPPPPVATHFSVSSPANAVAGSPLSFTVVALDALNNEVATYSGTLRFTSTDGQAVLPVNSTLAGGQGTFSATFKTVGNQTITATDTVKTTVTGATSAITVAAGPSGFSVTAPGIVI